jgi:uncharacterized OB-fold protein
LVVATKEEIIVFKESLQVPYTYSAGPVVSRFLIALRDRKQILGIRCKKCNLVYVPPRGVCGRCMSRLDEWVELKGTGKVETHTTVHYREPYHPGQDTGPIHYAIISLEGADTGLTHLLGEVKEKDIHVGMVVEPVFSEERRGTILDIAYFRPVTSPSRSKAARPAAKRAKRQPPSTIKKRKKSP